MAKFPLGDKVTPLSPLRISGVEQRSIQHCSVSIKYPQRVWGDNNVYNMVSVLTQLEAHAPVGEMDVDTYNHL